MMEWSLLQNQIPVLYYALMGGLGLVVGSFLTVVVARSPALCTAQEIYVAPRFHLVWPGSHCPQCQTPLRWFELIPVLSAICLKGRCRYCKTSLGWRDSAIELSCAGMTLIMATLATDWVFPWLLFFWWLLALAWIDAETQLLPDQLTLSLLWFGLLSSALGWLPIDTKQSVLGAVVGYLSLWCVLQAYWLIKRTEGMGHGDLKLLAAIGAWLGWLALPWVVLLGALGGIFAVLLRGWQQRHQPLPFGPALALGAVIYWLITVGMGHHLEALWALLLA